VILARQWVPRYVIAVSFTCLTAAIDPAAILPRQGAMP
jgi:hypothetical protein